jgi:hypothetical protein
MRWRACTRLLILLGAAAAGGCSATPEMQPRPDAPGDLVATVGAPDASPPNGGCVDEAVEGVDPPQGEAPVAPRACCAGLTRAPVYKGSILRLDECQVAPGGRFLCIRCGDGRCGKGENVCNCPADCH